ncbi:transposase [Streptomyces zaomyceticus]|uniref:transposase n=1 Tax=Streptomyces zaomyceticus TaxID=68286 RepID=UPI00364D17F3
MEPGVPAAEHQTFLALTYKATARNPGLWAACGVGPDTAAQLLVTAGGNPERMRTEASFAALRGAAPVPGSNRHRLSRGGDRGPNAALYRIALVRMAGDSRTREYVARQTAAGRTKKEIIRLLKRALVREMFRCLTTTVTVPRICGPAAAAAVQEHHAHRRRPPLRTLADRHLQPRTRAPPR